MVYLFLVAIRVINLLLLLAHKTLPFSLNCSLNLAHVCVCVRDVHVCVWSIYIVVLLFANYPTWGINDYTLQNAVPYCDNYDDCRVCFFTADSISQRGRFIEQVVRCWRWIYVLINFSDQELIKFVQFLKRSHTPN